jgi:hypothetical protein
MGIQRRADLLAHKWNDLPWRGPDELVKQNENLSKMQGLSCQGLTA